MENKKGGKKIRKMSLAEIEQRLQELGEKHRYMKYYQHLEARAEVLRKRA